MRITIDIDILNTEEVVKAHRGELVKLLTDVLLSKEKMKLRVEKAVCEEVVKALEFELLKGLKEEMIEANITYAISNEAEDENLYV